MATAVQPFTLPPREWDEDVVNRVLAMHLPQYRPQYGGPRLDGAELLSLSVQVGGFWSVFRTEERAALQNNPIAGLLLNRLLKLVDLFDSSVSCTGPFADPSPRFATRTAAVA
jgi:hypothetical protein